eukprot:g31731.t1
MWEFFKDLLIRVQDWHVPVKKKEKDGKVGDPWIMREVVDLVKREKGEYEKEMENSEFSVEHANMLGHFQMRKEVVLDLLKSIKLRPQGPMVSTLATGEVLED